MNTIDEYLTGRDSAQQEALQHIRTLIQQLVPEATEAISYGIPAFKYKGKYLIGFAGFKDHLSIFPGTAPIAVLDAELSAYQRSKGTIQFTLDHPLSDELISKIVAHSRKSIDLRA